jgi:S1-C subfamily serine protease
MVPSNILQRIFYISHNGATGTGFTIDVDGRQYLATARHVIEGLVAGLQIAVHRNSTWQPIDIVDIWHSPTGADVSLLSLKNPLSPAHPIIGGDSPSFFLSQQIYFLGFPYGLHMEGGLINNGYPVPFVKTGIVSSFSTVSGGSQLIYCDGHNNPGFSGGPIVSVSAKHEVTVIAVVSAYRYNEDPVLLNGTDTGLTYRANTGLVIGYNAKELFLQAAVASNGAPIV